MVIVTITVIVSITVAVIVSVIVMACSIENGWENEDGAGSGDHHQGCNRDDTNTHDANDI